MGQGQKQGQGPEAHSHIASAQHSELASASALHTHLLSDQRRMDARKIQPLKWRMLCPDCKLREERLSTCDYGRDLMLDDLCRR